MTTLHDSAGSQRLYELIIPAEVRDALRRLASVDSSAKWALGDLALRQMAAFRQARVEGRYRDIFEYQVWAALGYFANMSGKRVQQIASVCATFHPDIRFAHGEFEFGYYEGACVFEDEAHAAIQFLAAWMRENGEKPSIARFQRLYETVVQGRSKIDVEPVFDYDPDSGQCFAHDDAENADSGLPGVIQGILEASRRLKKAIFSQKAVKNGPAVEALALLLAQLEDIMPRAMAELGYPVGVEETAEPV